MNIIPEIFIPLGIGVIIFCIAFFKYPRYAIAGIIFAKPIIDLTADYHILWDISFLKIYAGLFAMLGIIYIIYHRINILQNSVSTIWVAFLCLNFLSIFVISTHHLFIDKVDYFLRILSGFVALLLFANLFDFNKDKKTVLSIFIGAGIFPMLLWVIPVLAGNPIESPYFLNRIVGPYDSFWVFFSFAMQTIICCLAYMSLPSNRTIDNHSNVNAFSRWINDWMKKNKYLKTILLHFMIIIGTIMVYKSYTKSGWVIILLWFFIWFLLREKYFFAALVPGITALLIFVSPIAWEFQKLYHREINYYIHKTGERADVFMGRMGRWDTGMNDFRRLSVAEKLVGSKEVINHPENDFLRILWDNGITGFVVFVALLGTTGFSLMRIYVRNKDPVVLMGVLVFIMYLLSAIGISLMLYPSFQWFMWGISGFILYADKSRARHTSV